MIYFDVRFNSTLNAQTSTVSIRKISTEGDNGLYAYEINTGRDRRRGTVRHQGTEDFALISSVLSDYTRQYGR